MQRCIDHGRLVVEPTLRPRYSLDELLAQCDESAEISKEDHDWPLIQILN